MFFKKTVHAHLFRLKQKVELANLSEATLRSSEVLVAIRICKKTVTGKARAGCHIARR